MASADQAQLQAAAQEYQKVQEELQVAVDNRQKLEAQQHENKGVQTEFQHAKPDEAIYKLVGPVLLKQEKEETLSTVNGRLEYIENELKRAEESIKAIQKRAQEKQSQIMQLQSTMQQAAES